MLLEALASGTGGGEWSYIVLMKAPLGAYIKLDDGDEEAEAYGAGVDTLIGIPLHNGSSAYTLTVTMNGLTAPTQTVNTPADTIPSGGISDVITVNFAKVIITFDDNFKGQTLSITDGTHTASPAPTIPNETGVNTMDIYLPYTGNWTMTANDPVSGDDFNVKPDPVTITSLTQVISNGGLFVIPDGSTVTPTDDIETWLLCADIKDKSYTTLAEVLADEETLYALLTSDNANDYLVRSKSFIGKKLVPTLYSDNSSDGVAFCSAHTENNNAYKVFDNLDDTAWWSAENVNSFVGYHFTNPVVPKSFMFRQVFAEGFYRVGEFKIQGSNDSTDGKNGTWDDLYSGNGTPDLDKHYFNINNDTSYEWLRLFDLHGYNTSGVYTGLSELQFYDTSIDVVFNNIITSELAMQIIGADDYASDTLLSDSDWCSAINDSSFASSVLNAKVPNMTGYTTPSGEVIESRNDNSHYGWLSFNGNLTTADNGWYSGANAGYPQYLGYKFGRPVSIKKIFMMQEVSTPEYFRDYKLQGSNDGFDTDINDIESFSDPTTTSLKIYHVINQNNQYSSYRILFTAGPTNQVSVQEIQFYGREAAGVQTWLKAAGIKKPYTTVAEVLEDHTTLQKLISNHDAVDYLVTAKGFIDDIVNDESAMRYIGLRNYAADTLLADADWNDGIFNSAYMSSVLNTEVPVYSADDPKILRSSEITTTQQAYKAFDGVYLTSSCWTASDALAPHYIGYNFDKLVKLHKASIAIRPMAGYNEMTQTGKFQGSKDGVTWDDLTDEFTWIAMSPNKTGYLHYFVDTNGEAYSQYRLYVTVNGGAQYNYQITCNELQLHCREDVDETKIKVISAANDLVKIADPSTPSTQTPLCTTGLDGVYELVKGVDITNGTYIFTSTTAKDPSDFTTKDYSKKLTIDNDTFIIELFPDDAIYWYGYVAVPYTGYPYGMSGEGNGGRVAPTLTFDTNNYEQVQNTAGSAGCINWGGKIDSGKFDKIILFIKSSTMDQYRPIYGMTNELRNGFTWSARYEFVAADDADYTRKELNIPSDGYLITYTNRSGNNLRKIFDKAMLLNKKDRVPTYISAANDTLYILDGATQIPIATTDANGRSYDPLLKPGTYDIYSTVVNDPDDFTSPYHKQVTITSFTKTVKVMPTGALYWYGNVVKSYELGNYHYQGLETAYNRGTLTVTLDSDHMNAAAGYHTCGNVIFGKVDCNIYSKFRGIVKAVSNDNWGGVISLTSELVDYFVLDASGDISKPTFSDYALMDVDISAITSEEYPVITVANWEAARNMDIKALWLE